MTTTAPEHQRPVSDYVRRRVASLLDQRRRADLHPPSSRHRRVLGKRQAGVAC